MFLELGWSCLELELSLNSSWTFCLGVLVQVSWHSLYLSVFVRAMWLFDVLVLLLMALLCGLLWMGWQFKIYIAKLRAQEARFAELEGRIQAVQSDATAISTKKTVRSGVQTEWNQMCFYMRPHSRVLHKEDCQYLQGPGVKELHLCQICFQRWWLYLGSLFGKRPAQRLAVTCIGLITKGLEDNNTEELLEPWSSEAKVPSWKAFEKQIWNVVSVCLDYGWMILVWGVRVPKAIVRDLDTWYPLGSIPIPKKNWTPRPYPEDRPWHQFPLT